MANNVTIRGVRRLARKLRDMPGPVREATRQAIEEQAAEITNTMRTLVPYRTGALYKSIGWSWGDVPRKIAFIARSTPVGGHVLSIFAGNVVAFYARWVEFGTQPHSLAKRASVARGKRQGEGAHHPGTTAQPFFFPAFRAHRREAKRKIAAAARKALKHVAAQGGADV